jgi:hypothetical protein
MRRKISIVALQKRTKFGPLYLTGGNDDMIPGMSRGTRPLKALLAAEVAAACLLLVVVLGWRVWPRAVSIQSDSTPAASALTETPVNASPTPFEPDPDLVLLWGPGQNPPAIATAGAFAAAQGGDLLQPPTAIPDIIPTPGSQGSRGPLNYPQQLRLYIASLRFVAPSAPQALRLARELDFVGRDSHPSNMCGPLSIAILREAGLISPETNLPAFWLLNPRQPLAQKLLAETFPAERFDHLVTQTPLNKIDWKTSPLQAGDFLYLYAGQGGNFEHMLVVNRIDADLRAYAVTNYATDQGFVIQERLLYDPNDPSAGLFTEWTRRPFAILGSTGFGGFEVWRLRQP